MIIGEIQQQQFQLEIALFTSFICLYSESVHFQYNKYQTQKMQEDKPFQFYGRWKPQEHLKFLVFMRLHSEVFASMSPKSLKKSLRIFKFMAKFIKTRSPLQCRGHFHKLFKSGGGVIKFQTSGHFSETGKLYFDKGSKRVLFDENQIQKFVELYQSQIKQIVKSRIPKYRNSRKACFSVNAKNQASQNQVNIGSPMVKLEHQSQERQQYAELPMIMSCPTLFDMRYNPLVESFKNLNPSFGEQNQGMNMNQSFKSSQQMMGMNCMNNMSQYQCPQEYWYGGLNIPTMHDMSYYQPNPYWYWYCFPIEYPPHFD